MTRKVFLKQRPSLESQSSPLSAPWAEGIGSVGRPGDGNAQLNMWRSEFGVSCFQSCFQRAMPENVS